MADNVSITAGTGTNIATDDVGGVQYQRVKVSFGADGSASDTSSTNPLPVTEIDNTTNGTITANAQTIALALNNDAATAIQITGTWVGTIQFEATTDGTNWRNIYGLVAGVDTIYTSISDIVGYVSGYIYRFTTAGFAQVRVRSSAWTSGTATVYIRSAASTSGVYLNFPIPAGTNNIGLVQPAPLQVRVQVTPTISSSPAYTSGDCVGGLQTITNAARASGGSGIIQSITVLDKTQAQRAAMDILFFNQSVTVAGDNAAVAMSDADMANCIGVVSIGPYNTAWPGTPLNSFATIINVGLPFVCSGSANLYAQAVVRGTPTYTSTSDLVFSYGILQD